MKRMKIIIASIGIATAALVGELPEFHPGTHPEHALVAAMEATEALKTHATNVYTNTTVPIAPSVVAQSRCADCIYLHTGKPWPTAATEVKVLRAVADAVHVGRRSIFQTLWPTTSEPSRQGPKNLCFAVEPTVTVPKNQCPF